MSKLVNYIQIVPPHAATGLVVRAPMPSGSGAISPTFARVEAASNPKTSGSSRELGVP